METITGHLKEVGLVEISIGKTNPRREFNDASIGELSESIRKNGLLQPILVRPTAKGYELVCGERRLRACRLINLESVPAQVKELNDQEALEAQIVENLEREDVHPIDEAETFKLMLEQGNYNIGDIATKIARSETFILQRLSLNNLNAEWKKLFLKGVVNLSKALIIARLEKKYQKEVAQVAKDWQGGIKSTKQLQAYIDSNITAQLSKALFDPKDENLIMKAGACPNCPKRSGANCSLFPDVKENDRCFDKSCFNIKTQKYIQNEIDGIISGAENVYLIKPKHQDIEDSLADKLKKLKIRALTEYDDFDTVRRRDKRKNKIMGFWVSGYQKGQYVPIMLSTKKDVRALDPKSKEGVAVQIEKINTRAERMLELDAEKVHKRIIEAMAETEELTAPGRHNYCKATELMGRLVLWNALGWPKKQHFGKLLEMNKYDKEGPIGLLKRLEELSMGDMAIIINNVGFDSFKSSQPIYSEALALRRLAESF
ncbi:ParB/RepB/Spo0J family partition protein, partial [Snuella sedimenti]